jgi:hypothetical protein
VLLFLSAQHSNRKQFRSLLEDQTVLRVSSMMRIVLDNTDNTVRVGTPPTSPHAGADKRRKSCFLDPNPQQRRGSAPVVPAAGGMVQESNKERRGSVRGHSAAKGASTGKAPDKYLNRHTMPTSLLRA